MGFLDVFGDSDIIIYAQIGLFMSFHLKLNLGNG